MPGWDISCFYFHDAPVQVGGVDNINLQRADQRINVGNIVRYFPSTLPGVRTHHLNLLDFSFAKSFSLPRSATLAAPDRVHQRAELHRALESRRRDPRATSGLFGVVNQDRNNPRDIQIGVRVTF